MHVFKGSIFLKKILMFTFERERKRQSVSGGGQREREGDTESKAGSRLQAVSAEPNAGLKPTNCEVVT